MTSTILVVLDESKLAKWRPVLTSHATTNSPGLSVDIPLLEGTTPNGVPKLNKI